MTITASKNTGAERTGTLTIAAKRFTVTQASQSTPITQADLAIQSLQVSKNILTTDESFTLSATIHNNGPGNSVSVDISYYYSFILGPSIEDRVERQRTVRVNPLASGESITKSIRLDAPSTPGTYYYGAWLAGGTNDPNIYNDLANEVRVTVSSPAPETPSSVCDRTAQVRDAIVRVSPVRNCANVTEDHLNAIRSLSLYKDGITTLQQSDFDELRSLERLSLDNNNLRTLPEGIFWYLTELEDLNLRNNQLTTLEARIFRRLSRLEYLDLSGNQLTALQRKVFDNLDNLIELRLEQSQLSTLEAKVFEDLSSLEELHLYENQLTTLPVGVFNGLDNLEWLNLENNHLTTLPTDIFKGLDNLEYLDLEGNPLTTIETGAFNGLNSFTDLDLSGYSLTTIEVGAFNGLNNLTDLRLNENQLTTLPTDVFKGLASLEDLDLAGNQFTTLRAGVFNGLNNLTDLYLDENQLTTIPTGVFNGLNNLTDLYLDENQLTTIPTGVFNGLNNLIELRLNENQLTTLPIGVFNGLNNLIELRLNENQLTTLPIGVFNGLNNLEDLRLNENQLTTLPKGIFDDVLDTLHSDLLEVDAALKATLGFEATMQDATEGETVTVTVSLSQALPVAVRVPYTVGGTATAADYTNLQPPAELLFLAGETNKEIVFTLLEDADTAAETVLLTLGDINEIRLRKSDGSGPDAGLWSGVLLDLPQPRVHTVTVTTSGGGVLRPMYWTDGHNRIYRSKLDGTQAQVLVVSDGNPSDIALDVLGGKMYWTDTAMDAIQRANLDGSGIVSLVTDLESPEGIALDVSGGKMYWIDYSADKIQRANLNGSGVEDLVTGLDRPLRIALDVSGGKMYWTDVGTDKIQRANLNGSGVEDLVTGLGNPRGIALDMSGGKIYWTDSGTNKIQRANLNGSGVEDLVTNIEIGGTDIALDVSGGKMYWADNSTDKIQRANLDGSQVEVLVTGGYPIGIALAITLGEAINRPPLAVGTIPAQTLTVGGSDASVNVSGHFQDQDSNRLIYTATLDNTGVVTVSVSGAVVTITPKGVGSATVTVMASDGTLTTTQSIAVTVKAASTTAVCDRTPQVRDAILAMISGVSDCADVTQAHLNSITGRMELSRKQITTLEEGDFIGLENLTSLVLEHNQFTTLDSNIFTGLNSLTYLSLNTNAITTLPSGVFSGLPSLTSLALEITPLTTLDSNLFSGLNSLTNLYLGQNQLSTLPEGVFSGLSNLTTLELHTNPGAPFTLTLKLARTDNANPTAPGPATVKVQLAEGAPFDMSVNLSVQGGVLSAHTATIATGNTESGAITVTQSGTGSVTVSLGTAPEIPQEHHRPPERYYTGIQMAVGDSLVLFATDSNQVDIPDANLRAQIETALNKQSGDPITDTEMATLTSLDARNANISDLTGLEHATDLTSLNLQSNSISDISLIAGLTNLTSLNLQSNSVSDISPLVASSGLGSGDEIDVRGNPLNYPSITTHIPTLQSRGATVEFDTRTPTTLEIVSGNNQQGVPDVALANPFVVEVQDGDSEAFEGVPVTFAVTAGGGTLSVTSTTTDSNGRAESTLTLGSTPGENTVSMSATGIQEAVIFNTATPTAPIFTEGDSTTREIVENTAADVNIGIPVAATDADSGDTLTYTLGGTDAASFDIESGTGQLKTKATLDYETKSSYTVTVTVSDGNGGTDTITVTITVTDVNEDTANSAPTFTAGDSTTRSIAENTAADVNIGTPVEATDADSGDTLTYTLSGTDAASFDIDSTTGQLKTKAALDYETKNAYTVTVTGSDGTLTDTITVTINVSDVDEPQATVVNIPDATLRAKIETALNKKSGDPITAAEMATLTRLNAGSANISDLTGLKFATNLTYLNLYNNNLKILPAGVFEGLSKVTTLNLRRNPLTTIKTGAFNGLSSLTELDLRYMQLTIIEGGAFNGLDNLQTLNLYDNEITTLPTGVFEGLNNVTSLNLRSNLLKTIKTGAFNGLSSLTKLDLRAMQLETIESLAFNGLDSLQTLDLYDNNLATLPTNVFEGLNKVTSLNLKRNPLKTIKIGAFNGLSSLTKLDLRAMQLETIESLAFNGLDSLQTLDLYDNNLATLPTNVFEGLNKVTSLNLKRNPLKTIKTGAFNGLSSLTELNLSSPYTYTRGTLTTIETGAFKGLINLKTLNLYYNKITTLPTGVFEGLNSVTSLDLRSNLLETIEKDAFNGLSKLTKLDLRDMRLETIESGAFNGLDSLQTLDLYDNNLATLPTDVFEGLNKVTSLNLKRNPLTTIKIGAFNGLSSLTKLDLSSSYTYTRGDLTTIEGGAFKSLSNLTELNLYYNKITTLPTGVFEGLNNVTTLNLRRNPLKTIKAGAFNGLSNLKTLDLSSVYTYTRGDLITIESGAFNGLSNLTELNLYYNNLKILPTGVFEGLNSLTKLNLNRNRGTPFTLTLELARTDTTDPTTPGPATVVVKLAQGAPFEMTVNLSVEGGTLSAPTATIARGKTESEPITVAQDGVGSVTISLGDAPRIPSSYYGIRMAVSDSLVLFGPGSIPTQLVKISGDDQRGAFGTALANPLVVEVLDAENSGVQSIDVMFAITAGDGTLSTTRTATDRNGQAESVLTLGPNLGTNTVSVSAAGIEQQVTFNALATPPETKVMVIEGTITNRDGTPAEAGVHITVTIGSNTQTTVSEAGGVYRVTFINPLEVLARSLDTVEVQVVRQVTGESARQTVQLSSEQIIAQRATIDIQFSIKEYLLSVPSGISLIHVPLKVTAVDGVSKTIESVGDLYDVLGGTNTVSLLITHDPKTQRWNSYLGGRDKGKPGDKALTDNLGIIAVMKNAKSVRLTGNALGINGSSSITLHPGTNLVGVPLKDSRIARVSDLFALEGIAGNVAVIIVSDNGKFKVVARAGDAGDVEIAGGQSFILTAREAATVIIEGDGWASAGQTTVAPPIVLTGIQANSATPVLAVSGSIVDEVTRLNKASFRVIVKNLSTGKAVTTVTEDEGLVYQITVVDLETGRVAQIGDTLEITAQSLNPLVRVQPLRYMVTAEDVKRSLIEFGALVAYEIPAKTELLLNYPNPFNPETWIAYRLAEDANVTLTIYDLSGGVVRRLNIGHRLAAVYESRSKAIYWDGRTEFGERVASGIYFYHLSTGDYSATRKMVILK